MSGAIRSEARLFLAARANLALVAVLTLLAALAAWNGVARLRADDTVRAAAIATDRDAFDAKRKKIAAFEAGRLNADEATGALKPQRAVLGSASNRLTIPPRAELGMLSAASARPTPEQLPVGVGTRFRDEDPTLGDPTNRLDGAFDLSFVATWLLPLFALLLGFDVLARDREHGIAPVLAAQGRTLGDIAAARLAVRSGALLSPVATVAVIATLASEGAAGLSTWAALAVWLAGVALLLGFWLALAAVVNARARSAAAASLILIGLWIVSALLVPALVSAALARLAPPPDRLAGVLALRATETDLTRHRAQVTAAFYAADPLRRPRTSAGEYDDYFVGEYYPRALAFDRAFGPYAAGMEARRVAQARALRLASLLSPTLALRLLSEDLAGGSPERRVTFLASVDAFRDRWRGHFDRKLASMTPLNGRDYATAPAFVATPENGGDRRARIALLLAALALPSLIALLHARRMLRRASPL